MIKMIKKLIFVFVIFMIAVMSSCAQAQDDGTIDPGDKIGSFLIATGVDEELVYMWDLENLIRQGEEEIYSVEIPVGTKMNVSSAIYNTVGSSLDEKWKEHTYKMFINDRPVNLEAFGPIDTTESPVGAMRAWNVVITTTEPGEITVRTEGTVGGEPFGDTTTYIFTTP
jgi:hydroxylamine reductase (hybrid-cluster protein)